MRIELDNWGRRGYELVSVVISGHNDKDDCNIYTLFFTRKKSKTLWRMEIKGKVHCFFEQSGTFKNEFKKLGIEAEDYDIQNNFGKTDHVIDLFAEIEKAYSGG